MTMSPETAEWVSDWSNWVLLASLLVGVAATYLIVVSSGAKEDALKRELQSSQERIAKLGTEAEALRAQAEADRLARAKIEEKLAPRTLSAEQQREIIERIKPFAPQRFQFVTYPDDQEAVQLVHTLAHVLVAAGWQGIKMEGFLMAMLETGVQLSFSPEGERAYHLAGAALADALNDAGLDTAIAVNEKYKQHDRIQIRVGKKP